MTNIVHVQQAERTERQIIDAAIAAVSNTDDAAWTIGQCAAEWCQRWAQGRTDADFAALIGMMPDSVGQRRRVYERFAASRETYPGTFFSHFRAALAWDDAHECLSWASENGASYKEMVTWRRFHRGDEGEVEPDDGANEDTDEPHEAAPQEMERPVKDDRPAVRDHDVDRTKLAPEPDDDLKQRVSAARAMWRAARDLAVLNAAAAERVANRLHEEVKVCGSEIEVPDKAVLEALLK